MKKKIEISGKKWGPNSGFVVTRKSSKALKKSCLKKILPAYLCGYDLQNAVSNFFFFLINGSQDI